MRAALFLSFLLTSTCTGVAPAFAWPLGSPMHSAQIAASKKAQAIRAADSGSCYSVADADTRNYCLAKAHGDAGRCYSIQRQDLRAWCLAEVRR